MDVVQMVIGAGIVLGVIAFVAWPLLGGRRATPRRHAIDDVRVERRIVEYREALRRRTVCERCLYANVTGARYCAECGARLAATSADDAGTASGNPARASA